MGTGTDSFFFFGRRKQLAIAWLSVPMSPPSRTSHRHPSVLASREKAVHCCMHYVVVPRFEEGVRLACPAQPRFG